MISDSYIVPECIIGPGSFGGLMALYESNFIKFSKLAGDILDSPAVNSSGSGEISPFVTRHYCSRVPADCDLFLSVESSTRYTQVLRLTYRFSEDDEMIADPDLMVRVYLDARMTEVAGWASHHQHAVLRDLAKRFTRELDKRWSRNMMLSKWLDYLTEKGHSFHPVTRTERQFAEVS